MATDLAAAEYRSRTLGADGVLYVVDARQGEHLAQVFALARSAGLVRPETALRHVGFGTMSDANGRAFKSRHGETVPLEQLVDQALGSAREALEARGEEATPEKVEAIGVGALKYADLSKERTAGYRYDAKRMSALDGNTALYLQYTRARLAKLARKAGDAGVRAELARSSQSAAERALAVTLARWGEAFDEALEKARPHIACEALYRIARAGAAFYEACPVLGPEAVNAPHRAALAGHAAATLGEGLATLGIEAPEAV